VGRAPIRLWLLVVAAVTALAWNLGGFHFLDPDEGRTAEIAREMVASGDFVVPHLDGLPYLDKPVCYFAAAAVAMMAVGQTEAAVRLPALLATVGTMALLVAFARRRWGATAGCLAGLAFATMPLTLGYAHAALIDSMLTLSTTAAILAFADDRPALAWGAMAVGALTKGPVALAVPLVTLAPYAMATGVPLRRFVTWPGVVVFGIVALPWCVAVTAQFPAFPTYVFGRETFLRFATTTFHRSAPLWYYLPILAAGAFPWIVPACAGMTRWRAAWQARREPAVRESMLFAAWVLGPLVLFTLDRSKLPQYVLPVMPAIALAAARTIALRGPGVAAKSGVAAALALAAAFLVISRTGTPLPLTPAEWAAVPGTALALSVALAGSAVGLGLAALSRRRDLGALAYALPGLVLPVASQSLMAAVGDDRSSAALAAAIAPALAGGVLFGVATFPPSLPFYLRHSMLVATGDGHELTSTYVVTYLGTLRGPTSPLKGPNEWRRALDNCPAPTVFVVPAGDTAVRRSFAELPVIADDGHNVAFGPCQPPRHE